MFKNLIIKNAHIIDTWQQIDRKLDISISNGLIDKIEDDINHADYPKYYLIDAEGCYLTPGFIDSHVHTFYKGSDLGVDPDLVFLPNGVTYSIDGGSAGLANCESLFSFFNQKIQNMSALINVSPTGLCTLKYPETIDPRTWDIDRFRFFIRKYGDRIAGLKIRIGDPFYKADQLETLKKAVSLAEELNTRISVHVTNSDICQSAVLRTLRKGDIYCHVYQGFGETVVKNEGIIDELLEARERGVILDAASGQNNFSFDVARCALKNNILPDVICSDVSSMNYLSKYIGNGLPFIISRFLALGMELREIVKRVTENPAKIYDIPDQGSLRIGNIANLAVFSLVDKTHQFEDIHGQKITGNCLMQPKATIVNGELFFNSLFV